MLATYPDIYAAQRHTAVVGYGADNSPVWGQVGKFEESRRVSTNWFCNSQFVQDGTALEALFSGFWRQWFQSRDELTVAIESYVHSNVMCQAGIPADAVAKSYAGLEILASLHSGKTIAGRAAKKIDRQLEEHDIPYRLLYKSQNPITYSLAERIMDKNSNSGAYLLNEVRNYIAHPLDTKSDARIKRTLRRHLDMDMAQYFDLHDLSQFYLEYLLLGLCEYQVREYRNLRESFESETPF